MRLKENRPLSYYVEVENNVPQVTSIIPPTTEAKLLAKHITVRKGDRILDLSNSSGAIAIIAGLRGANGIAVAPESWTVETMKEHFASYHLAIEAREGVLFTGLPKRKFDVIYANGPSFELYGDKETQEKTAIFYGILFGKAKRYLKKKGKLFLTFPGEGDKHAFERLIRESQYEFSFLTAMTSEKSNQTYLLYEITLPRYTPNNGS